MVDKKDAQDNAAEKYEEFSLDSLVEAVVENFEETTQVGDPFEYYVQSVRAHIHGDKDQYKTRVTIGYKTLMQELSKNPVEPI